MLVANGEAGLVAYVLDLKNGLARAITPTLASGSAAVSPDERLIAALPAGGVLTAYPIEEGSPEPFRELGVKYVPVGWGKTGLLLREADGAIPAHIIQFDTRTGSNKLLTTLVPRRTTGVSMFERVRVSGDANTVAYSYGVYQSSLFALDLGRGLR
jgi:hypothetical protein